MFKILALRLLRTVLTEFRNKNMVESAEFLKKMSQLMGECLITCVKDPTLQAAGKIDVYLREKYCNTNLFSIWPSLPYSILRKYCCRGVHFADKKSAHCPWLDERNKQFLN